MKACCQTCSKLVCTCSTNYWILSSGDNMLKGCPCDPTNPPKLEMCEIVWAMSHSPKAWSDFWALYPSLFPCEKERFDTYFAGNPFSLKQIVDEQVLGDQMQSLWNKQGVYTIPPKVTKASYLPPTVLPKLPRRC